MSESTRFKFLRFFSFDTINQDSWWCPAVVIFWFYKSRRLKIRFTETFYYFCKRKITSIFFSSIFPYIYTVVKNIQYILADIRITTKLFYIFLNLYSFFISIMKLLPTNYYIYIYKLFKEKLFKKNLFDLIRKK